MVTTGNPRDALGFQEVSEGCAQARVCARARVCVRARARAYVHVCVHGCVRVCVPVSVRVCIVVYSCAQTSVATGTVERVKVIDTSRDA